MIFTGSRHRFGLRLFLTTAWLIAAAGTVLWYWLHNRRETPDLAVETFAEAQRLGAAGRPVEALHAVENALVLRPQETGYLIFKGYRELDLARQHDAEASFRRALDLQATNAEARLGLGQALASEGKADEARSTLGTLPPIDLTAAELHRRAQIYAGLSSYELALQDTNDLLVRSPNDARLLVEASALALAVRDWQTALSLSKRLASVTDDAALKLIALERQGMALRSLIRLEDAYRAYQQAATPENLEVRADLALQLQHFADAAGFYRALLDRRPDDVEWRRRLAYTLDKSSKRQEAEIVYRGLVEQGAADTVTRVRYAWLLNSEGRYAEAWPLVARLPRTAIDSDVLNLQARTAAWAGMPRESVVLLRAALEQRPDAAELWKLLAESYRTLNDETSRVEALRAYLRLSPQDWAARHDLASALARTGSVDQAIAEYHVLVAEHPREVALLRELGLLLESAGRLGEAIPLYARAVEAASEPAPDLCLRLARLNRWSHDPAAAVGWYRRYLTIETAPAARRGAKGELALALFESGDTAASLDQIEALARQAPLEPQDLLTGARAATARGRPVLAVQYLDSLAERRPLDRSEQIWLAGQLRTAGRSDRALALLELLVSEEGSADPVVLEAAGDLRAGRGDYRRALELYRRVGSSAVLLKIARAASLVPDFETASRAYAEYTRANPANLDAQLEAARYFARTNQPNRALPAYETVVSARGADGLRVELARAELQGEHFREAEDWARQAFAAGESTDDAVVALVQSLHLQGRSVEARQFLRTHPVGTGANAEALVWLGHASEATDRHLESFQAFDHALSSGAQPRGTVWIWRGQAAQKRGDLRRAEASYDAALDAGAATTDVRVAQKGLHASTLPRLETPVIADGDSNDLRLTQAGIGAAFFLPGDWARIGATILRGTLDQRAFHTMRTVNEIAIDHLFPVPQLELQASVGQELYGSSRLTTAHGGGQYIFSDGVRVGGNLSRESLLSIRDGRDPREFNRIIDLAALGPAFEIHRVEGFLDTAAGADGSVRVSAGRESFEDGNRRLFSYIHYQVPLMSGVRHWIALRPNAYLESFVTTVPAYFSPRQHLTLGTMLHGVFAFPRWSLETEVNPHLLRTDGNSGFGIHGVTSLTVHWGPVDVGGDAFIFYDGLAPYSHWRAAGRLTLPLAR